MSSTAAPRGARALLEKDEIAFSELIAPFVRQRRLIGFVAAAGAVVGLALRLALPPWYEARTTFVPEAPRSGSLGGIGSLTSLAGQLGLTPPNLSAYSPDFFGAVLRSREVLQASLMTELPDPRGNGEIRRPLVDLLGVNAPSLSRRLEKGVRTLRKQSSVAIDQRTSIVSLSVRSRDPNLAAAEANLLVSILDSFNILRRQSRSREERVFTEKRLADAQRELQDAENAQLRFLTENRLYQASPVLRFEANRLERVVQLKQEVYVTLSKAYEDARIEEFKDTPLLTIIDHAEPPSRPSSLGRITSLLVGFFAGVLLGIALALWTDYREGARISPGPTQSMDSGERRIPVNA